jgi:hypothetical protein
MVGDYCLGVEDVGGVADRRHHGAFKTWAGPIAKVHNIDLEIIPNR